MKKDVRTRHSCCVNLVLYLIGIILMPVGVVMTIMSGLGAGGYDAWNFALAGLLGQPVSSGIYISSVCVILLTAVIRRRIPRFTTFITSFLLGVFTDLWQRICLNSGISTLHPYLLFAGGMIIVAFCAAAYMEGDLPPGPTDDLVVAFHRKGLGLGNVKLVMDLICAAMAFCLGGEIGAGTVLLTFGLGPLIGGFQTYILKAVNKFENRGKTYENEDRENFCGGPDD